jgi:two-component system sensor histidine kinase DegS
LVNRRFGLFVTEGDRRAFSDFLEKVLASQAQAWCEVTLPQAGAQPLLVRIEGTRSQDRQECRAVVLDITERKQAEKRVRMFSQEIIAAREEERKKVASVLHHDVGSLTVGISAHLDVIEQVLRSGKPGEALEWMKRTRKLFDESVARLKGVAVQLRPPELDAIGLCGALRQYFSAAPRHGGARIHFKESLGRRQVPGGPATILFRVAQEALTNAIAHGRAQQVNVDLRASKEAVTLTVHDNGKGFDPSEQMARRTSQMGLCVMREMALSAGGDFTIDSGRGKGTTVRVRLPIADSSDCGLRNADCGLKERTT